MILSASRQDMFFSHRIYFFFQAMIFSDDMDGNKKRELGEVILKQIKRICIESENLLCLSNSKDVINTIIKLGMLKQYPHLEKHLGGSDVSLASDTRVEEAQANMARIANERSGNTALVISQYQAEQESRVKDSCVESIQLEKGESVVDLE